MAMTKCKECKSEISNKAKACPNCGAKVQKQVGWVGIVFVLLVAWVIFSGIMSVDDVTSQNASTSGGTSSSPSTQEPKKPTSKWSTSVSVDEMTGSKQAFANSVRVSPTRQMQFPYSDVKAWLGVGCDGDSEWAYFGFSTAPNLTNENTESGYDIIDARIKWDDEIQQTRLTQEWGERFIGFGYDEGAISKITSSSTVLLELSWHGEGNVNFRFPLKGSAAALNEMRSKCRS